MRVWVGRVIAAIGVAHLAFGAVVLGDLFAPALREGLFNTINASTPPERNMTYWFLMLGVVAVLLGVAIDALERSGERLPAALPWGFLSLTVLGCVASPASGFWLMWVPTIGLFLQRAALRPDAEQAPQPDAPKAGAQ